MRRAGGWVILLLGVVLVIGGAAGAIVFGPDDRVMSGPHRFSSLGIAVVTAPAALAYSGPTIELTVTGAPSEPVFLGIGYDVDVRDYLADVAYTQIDSVGVPWDATTSVVGGQRLPLDGPEDLDWWLVTDAGDGSATVTFPLPEAAVDVVAMDPELRPGFEATVTAAVVRQGAFVGGLGLCVAGAGLLVTGWVLKSSAPARRRASARGRPVGRDKAPTPRSGAP